MLPMPPPPVRMLTAAIAAVVLLSALATAVLAIVVPPKPAWTFLAFEIVTAACCALALPFARGAYREGPGLALTCFSGAVFACSVLGYLSVQGALGTTSLKLWVLARVALAGILGASAAATVLIRNPRSWGVLAKGIAFLAPHIAIVAVLGMKKSGITPLMSLADRMIGLAGPVLGPAEGVGAAVRMGVIIVIALILGGLFCAGLHLVIRAFELCREPQTQAATPRPA